MSTQPAVEIQKIEGKLATLRRQADELVVLNAEDYTIACQIALAGRAEIKAIGFALDPGIASARQHLDKLRQDKQMYVDRYQPIVEIATKKGEEWKAEERRKAEEEQRRINEERRLEAQRKAEAEQRERNRIAEEQRKLAEKEAEAARKAGEIGKREAERLKKEAAAAAERERERAAADAKAAAESVQEVKVAPSVPKVAGIRARVNWKFRIVDWQKIPRAYLTPDDVKIGGMVRAAKDKAKAEAECPGIEVYSEDSI